MSSGFDILQLERLWDSLAERNTKALLITRRDQIVRERYATNFTRNSPHYSASLAKAVVGGLSMMLAIDDGRLRPDDPVARFVPDWAQDPRKRQITLRMLATHTSGVEDAEADDLPHDKLTGWKGDFWKRLPPPRDPFSLALHTAPVLDIPGTRARYSNPGIGLLSYCVTASLRGTTHADLRSLLKDRIFDPLGIPAAEWSIGYGKNTELDGLALVPAWGGGALSPNALARIGQLLLQKGRWNGTQLLSTGGVERAMQHAGLPNNSGLGWWINRGFTGLRVWQAAPADAFWGAGAGHQLLLVIPSLELVVVRSGGVLDSTLNFNDAIERRLVAPLMDALSDGDPSVHKPSPAIQRIAWAPNEQVIRQARGGDNWPLTWADDDDLYTAYGDGNGFEPRLQKKLSLGLAKVSGTPPSFAGKNLRAPSMEQLGDGAKGRKASGMLMVDGTLYLIARNAENSQIAWSADHGQTWTWCDWKFTSSFGCPTFLNFGRNYSGARDEFVYIYSPDTQSAYEASDRFVLARVSKGQIRSRAAYEFFEKLDAAARPVWTPDITKRGPVFERKGQCYRSGVSYNAGLKRYLWSQTLPGPDARFHGSFAIFDAPEPWGPWTETFHADPWDMGPGETSSFPAKWMSQDGRTLHLVFSGEDSFSVRQAQVEIQRVELRRLPQDRLRVIIETDAGGDPDDEQSLARFLLYANEWDIEGIIANRPVARERENRNTQRTGLGIVQAQLDAYAQCYDKLVQHDPQFPAPGQLRTRTVAGYADRTDGVDLIIAAVDHVDPRPIWFCNWGTDHGSAPSNLKRALDRVRAERGPEGYARFKNRLRLSSSDEFGEHTTQIDPPWVFWVDTFRPELGGKRWYHRFSAITATAGGFDIERDVRTGHGPLGALYPLNTTHPQKEGDTMTFLYLIQTGMSDSRHPGWGSWGGRYGLNESMPNRQYYWANQLDAWGGATNRDNTLLRWAADLQNDFRARMDWCVKDYQNANHPPRAIMNGDASRDILRLTVPHRTGEPDTPRSSGPDTVELSAFESSDPDGHQLRFEWAIYPEAGTYPAADQLLAPTQGAVTKLRIPPDLGGREMHVVLTVRDQGTPPLASYRRVIVTARSPGALSSP